MTSGSTPRIVVLNDEVFNIWNWRSGVHNQQGCVKAVEELKKGRQLKPGTQGARHARFLRSGYPSFATVIAVEQMRLDSAVRTNIEIKVSNGGYMPSLKKSAVAACFMTAEFFFKRERSRSVPIQVKKADALGKATH